MSAGTHWIKTCALIFAISSFTAFWFPIDGWKATTLANLFGHYAAILKAMEDPISYPPTIVSDWSLIASFEST